MRLAVLSDVHGNLAALEAVLNDLRGQQVDEVLLGGDLALGGRQPAEVLDLLIERSWPSVVGNADLDVLEVSGSDRSSSDPEAAWTIARLQDRHIQFLRSLPLTLRRSLGTTGDLLLAHATPWSARDVVRADAPEEQARRMLVEGAADIVVYGHIHSAYSRRFAQGLLISVGGIAWSNDRDPRPAYTILTAGEKIGVEVRRVVYDVDGELAAMDSAGLPLRPSFRNLYRSGGPWPVRA